MAGIFHSLLTTDSGSDDNGAIRTLRGDGDGELNDIERNLSDYGDSSGSGSDNLFEDVDESAEDAAEEAQDAEEDAVEEAQDAEENAAEEAQDAAEEAAATASITVEDCTQDFCENQVSSDYLLRYKVNLPEGITLDNCEEACTISFESIYEGEAWISVGFSNDGRMVGSDAVM
jgi:hypothetical protein